MIDRWTDRFFWPALIGAWAAVIVSLLAALVPKPFAALVFPSTVLLGALAAIIFVLMLFDPPTRRAIDIFKLTAEERLREMPWWERLFSPAYGDIRLLILNPVAVVAIVITALAGNQDCAVLGFLGFALSGLMTMLMLKRQPDNP